MTPTDVSVLTEPLPGSRVGLTIEVPSSRVDAAYERTLDRLGRRVKVQGFRPGKAPRALIEARIGPETLREEVAESLLPEILSQALANENIDPIDRPQVEVTELDRGRPGRFKARVSVMPEVQLPDLSTLEVERPHTEVDDDLIQSRIDALRERLAEIEPVEREAKEGDIVVGDVRVLVEDPTALAAPPDFVGRRELPDEAQKAIELELKDGVLVPELKTALIGRKDGDVAVADVEMPEDHRNEELAGRKARLEVTVHGVKEKRIPELTDEVAAQLSDGEQSTVDAFREAVRADLVANAERSDRLHLEQSAVQAAVEAAQVEIPDALIDHELEHQLEDMDRQLQGQGLRLERYLQYQGTTEQAFRAQMRPDVQARVKTDLVLGKLEKELDINPSDEEVAAYIREQAEGEKELADNLDQFLQNPRALDFFRHRLTRLRIVETLAERLGGAPAVTASVQEEKA